MANRYEDRYRGEPFRGERYEREERGFVNRAGDEVRSWFGDQEAERRRQFDERERARERERLQGRERGAYDYGWASERDRRERGYGPGERSWTAERWERPDRSSIRREYDRTGAADRDWNEPDRRSLPAYGYGGETGRDTSWSGPSSGTYREYGPSSGSRSGAEWSGERGRQGRFSGRGPKGYQRSDARISEDVCERLTDAPDIDASSIEVTVNNGEVTLSGTVSEREDKRRTEDLIEHISGVREVHNNLRVSR